MHYSDSAVREGIRVGAGGTKGAGNIFQARNEGCKPPAALVEKVYPLALELREAVEKKEIRDTPQLQAFMELLEYLAVLLCQDISATWDDMKNHTILQQTPFCTSEFKEFRQEHKRTMEEGLESTCLSTADAIKNIGDKKTAEALTKLIVLQHEQHKLLLAEINRATPLLDTSHTFEPSRNNNVSLSRIEHKVDDIRTIVQGSVVSG